MKFMILSSVLFIGLALAIDAYYYTLPPTLNQQLAQCELQHKLVWDPQGLPHAVGYLRGFEQCIQIRRRWQGEIAQAGVKK